MSGDEPHHSQITGQKYSCSSLCAGRSLLEDGVKSMIATLLHEAEHAERAAQRSSALCCLKVGT